MEKPLIFIVNDDGYDADGIQTVARAVAAFADVVVCAPATNQSAKSFSISLGSPLVHREHEVVGSPFPFHLSSLSGSPVDCVIFAMHELPSRLPADLRDRKPDLLISGINHGANLGGDVLVSGTVGAAVYASLHYSIPTIAASVVHKAATSQPDGPYGRVRETLNFEPAARFVADLARRVLSRVKDEPFLRDTTFNVNVPNTGPDETPPLEFEVAVGGVVNYLGDTFVKGPGDSLLLGGTPAFADLPGSDCNAVMAGRIAVTPLAVRAAHYPDTIPSDPSEGPEPVDESAVAHKGSIPPKHSFIKRAQLIQPSALMCPVAVTWATNSLAAVGGLAQAHGKTKNHVETFHPRLTKALASPPSLSSEKEKGKGKEGATCCGVSGGWLGTLVTVAVAAAAVGFGLGRMSMRS